MSSFSMFFEIRRVLRHAWFVLALGSQVALAQPVVGQTYKDFVPMGSGASVPLPEGIWKSTHTDEKSYPGEVWQVHVLKNQLPDAKVPYLVIRHETLSRPWGATSCQSSKNPNQYMVDTHGTPANALLQKCTRLFSIGDFQSWKNFESWTNAPDKVWWMLAQPGLLEEVPAFKTSVVLLEVSVQKFNGQQIRIEAFVLPPKGMSAGKFRDDFRAGALRSEHDLMSAWASIYAEALEQSFFNKKPQTLMALAYPVRTLADSQKPNPAQTSVAAANPNPQAVRDAGEAKRPDNNSPAQPVNQPPRAADRANATPEIRVSTGPSVPPVVVAPASDNSEKLKLEQERKAIDEEKRQMAAQLESMKQMLAKLQQENAAAAQAKSAANAAPVEPPKSQQPVTFANRKALVIGNDKYTDVSPLNNAAADADTMAKSLEQVGYKVFKYHNLTEKKFKQAVRDFRQQLNGGDEVLFFYAGHGVQLGAANYLLPVDIKGEGEDQVKDDAILLQKVLDELEEKKTKFALAVIDACRDNPFKGKGRALGGRGLAPTTAATGQMIMFSAGSGQQALDRLGDGDKEKNGLFTRVFAKEMLKPGVSVDRVLRTVRNEVVRLAKSVGHEQTPALYDQAVGEFYFRQ